MFTMIAPCIRMLKKEAIMNDSKLAFLITLSLLLSTFSIFNSFYSQCLEVILFVASMLQEDIFKDHYENKIQYFLMILIFIFMYFVFGSMIISILNGIIGYGWTKEIITDYAYTFCTQTLTLFVLLYLASGSKKK